MIVYGDRRRRIRSSDQLDRIARTTGLEALIEWGILEAGVADELCPQADSLDPVLEMLRRTVVNVARAYWSNKGPSPTTLAAALPETIEVSKPEGYCYYALEPRSYGEAALRFREERQPQSAVVIGIRGIGTSLSAVVAAVLEEAGCRVWSRTVRPRGHPFDRRVEASPMAAPPGAYYLIVDEGPGLSGSSFASVARWLTGAGIPADRIAFFPAWEADGSSFLSSAARETWLRHARYTAAPASHPPGRDLSAGAWRQLFYTSDCPLPAVQPQHERLKFLDGSRLFKFAGFGDHGRAAFDRAVALWETGFAPRPISLREGYLETCFVPGTPVRRCDFPWRVHRYLETVRQLFPSKRALPLPEIEHMTAVNAGEALGPSWSDRAAAALDRLRRAAEDGSTVQIDGRLLPHEWIETAEGYLKTDAVDHCDDHFFPGNQDSYWDLAAARIELGVPVLEATNLDKLRYYTIAYLSYRTGYCTMACAALREGPDCDAFRTLSANYRRQLRLEMEGREIEHREIENG